MLKIEKIQTTPENVQIQPHDQLLVTDENIAVLREILKDTEFYWFSGNQIVESDSFEVGSIIRIGDKGETNTGRLTVEYFTENPDSFTQVKAVEYVFVNP